MHIKNSHITDQYDRLNAGQIWGEFYEIIGGNYKKNKHGLRKQNVFS